MLAWLRRRLGVLTTLWLFSQGLTLSAFAMNLCCLVHDPADPASMSGSAHAGHVEHHGHGDPAAAVASSTDDSDCHAAVAETPADHCPMAGANGEPCPMHRGGGAAGSSSADCVVRGDCGTSDTALLSLFSLPGIIRPPVQADIVPSSLAVIVPQVNRIRPTAPAVEPPPPRA